MVRNVARRRVGRLAPKALLSCLLLAVGVLGLAGPATAFSNSFVVELSRYLGDWYEYARTPNQFEDNTLVRDGKEYGPCYAARTTYKADGQNAITLRNACERRASDGSVITESISGKAILRSGTQGRKLQIAFGSGLARFFQRAISGGGFPYWIYCIGPVNATGQYLWAVVSGPDRDYVFVLTRQRSIMDSTRTDILRCSAEHGLPVSKLLYRQQDPSK